MCFLCYAPKLPGDEVPINIACCFTQLHKQIAVYSLFFSIELALAAGIRRPRRHPRRRLSFMTKMRPSVGASCWRWCSTEMDEVDQYSKYHSISKHLSASLFVFAVFGRFLGGNHDNSQPAEAWHRLNYPAYNWVIWSSRSMTWGFSMIFLHDNYGWYELSTNSHSLYCQLWFLSISSSQTGSWGPWVPQGEVPSWWPKALWGWGL